jgi:16S rRNA (guanine(1405)-N(7))-methyltransferase
MPANSTTKFTPSAEEVKTLTTRLVGSRKYKALGLPPDTIKNLIHANVPNVHNLKDLEKIVRQKLHNIVAPYLESIDYAAASRELSELNIADKDALQAFCTRILDQHASTRERLPILEEFYRRIFGITGIPKSILDLACGLNPFSIPWMRILPATQYFAYDLHEPRVNLINDFFAKIGRPRLAEKQDILVDPPKIKADVAFFFKEAHRFEQRQHGCNRAFWEALNVRYLLVSLPVANLTGSRKMVEGQRILVERTIKDLPWTVHELLFDSEIVFCIDKGV